MILRRFKEFDGLQDGLKIILKTFNPVQKIFQSKKTASKRYKVVVDEKKRLESDANRSVGNFSHLDDENHRLKKELLTHNDALVKLNMDFDAVFIACTHFCT